MAKIASCLLVLVAAFFAVEGITIPPPRTQRTGKFFASSMVPQNITTNDPRCKTNGVFANLNDCTSYYACSNGTSQDRKCPEGMRFDTNRHCTFDENPDCGATTHMKSDESLSAGCLHDYGIFAYKSDCHKYIVCVDGVSSLRICPEKQWFQMNVGCVEGERCPSSPQPSTPRRNELEGVMEN